MFIRFESRSRIRVDVGGDLERLLIRSAGLQSFARIRSDRAPVRVRESVPQWQPTMANHCSPNPGELFSEARNEKGIGADRCGYEPTTRGAKSVSRRNVSLRQSNLPEVSKKLLRRLASGRIFEQRQAREENASGLRNRIRLAQSLARPCIEGVQFDWFSNRANAAMGVSFPIAELLI